jgi:hypothetical protein
MGRDPFQSPRLPRQDHRRKQQPGHATARHRSSLPVADELPNGHRPRPSNTHHDDLRPSHHRQTTSPHPSSAICGGRTTLPSLRTPGCGLMDQCSIRHDIPVALQATHQLAGARSSRRNRPSFQAGKLLTGQRLTDQRLADLSKSPSTTRQSHPIRRARHIPLRPGADVADLTSLSTPNPFSTASTVFARNRIEVSVLPS